MTIKFEIHRGRSVAALSAALLLALAAPEPAAAGAKFCSVGADCAVASAPVRSCARTARASRMSAPEPGLAATAGGMAAGFGASVAAIGARMLDLVGWPAQSGGQKTPDAD